MANTNPKNNGVSIPFQEQAFIDKWNEWLQYRKERRLATYVPTGLKRTFNKLVMDSGNDYKIAIQIIDQSLSNSWQGLFQLKTTFNGNTTQGFTQKPAPAGNVTTGGFGQF